MTRLILISLILLLGGCQMTKFRHREWVAGAKTVDIQIENTKWLAITATKQLDLELSNGTKFGASAINFRSDPNGIDALSKGIAEAIRAAMVPIP